MPGHIKKRKYASGREVFRARYPDPIKGGTAQHSQSFPTKKEAEAWLADQTSAVRNGSHVNPRDGERLLRDVADEWRDTWINLQPKTRTGYDTILRTHLVGSAEERRGGEPAWFYRAKVADIDTNAVQAFITDLSSLKKRETVGHVYNVLRSVLGLAARRRYIAANPCQDVALPKDTTTEERVFLTHAEVHALADAITPHYRPLVLTAAYTGLRAGELNGLRWKRLDLLHGTLRVEETLKPVGKKWAEGHPDAMGDLIFGPPKTPGSRRTVGLPQSLRTVLGEHQVSSPAGGAGPDDLVFTAPNGGPNRQSLFYSRHFKPAVRAALPEAKHGCRFHDLRHTCVAFLIERGVGVLELSRQMGHKKIGTTMDLYGHLYEGAEQRVAAELDAGWQEARTTVVPLRS